jgi:uncharacterized protein (DUF1697 family)
MARQIALLRGINLGSSKRVKMAELRALCERLGYEDVQTLLQSGNVVFSTRKKPATVERELHAAIGEELGVSTLVIVRTHDELAAVVAAKPFPDAEGKQLQVSFLDEPLGKETAKQVEDAAAGAEQVVIAGREVYAWHPDGIQRSALAALLAGKKLGVTASARNWNTVEKLLALAEEPSL